MRKYEFFKNLIIDEDEKKYAEFYLAAKGVEKHLIIKQYLLNWRTTQDIAYCEVATTYRYDKRVRNLLYKYIAYLEEFYRAVILDNYCTGVNQPFFTSKMKMHVQRNDNNLNSALENMEFSELINQVKKLPDKIKSNCFFLREHTIKNIDALIELRNAIMHNKFLIMFRFKLCFVQGVDENKSTSLKANIINLANFLPNEDIRKKLKEDVNECCVNNGESNKTKWDLPSQVVIQL